MTARPITFAAAVLLGIVSSGVAEAGTIAGTTTSDPTVNSALTGGTVINFDSTAVGMYSSLTIGNVTFKGVDADFTIGTDWNGDFNTRGGKSLYNDFDFAPRSFRFDFATSVTGFAFCWGAADEIWVLNTYDSAGTLLNSQELTATYDSNDCDYFGYSSADIKYATLIMKSTASPPLQDFVLIDSFTHTAIAVVPLPPSSLMGIALLGGLGCFAWLRRRRNAGSVA